MALFQTRPETIEAIQFLGFNGSFEPSDIRGIKFSEEPDWLDYFLRLEFTHPSSIIASDGGQYLLVAHRVLFPGGWIIFDRRETRISSMPNHEFSAKYRPMETPAS